MEIIVTHESKTGSILFNEEDLIASIDLESNDKIVKDGYHVYIKESEGEGR